MLSAFLFRSSQSLTGVHILYIQLTPFAPLFLDSRLYFPFAPYLADVQVFNRGSCDSILVRLREDLPHNDLVAACLLAPDKSCIQNCIRAHLFWYEDRVSRIGDISSIVAISARINSYVQISTMTDTQSYKLNHTMLRIRGAYRRKLRSFC